MSRKRYSEPVITPPKFAKGTRVRITDEGVKWQIAPAGTCGTVMECGICVRVHQDHWPEDQSTNYAPDFWEEAQ